MWPPEHTQVFSKIIMKLGQNVCLLETQMSMKIGHVGSKTRSLRQMLEKPRGQFFYLIIMKLGQNVCFGEISGKVKNGSCWVKN